MTDGQWALFSGLTIKEVKTTAGKNRDSAGSIRLVLESPKENITTGNLDFNDFLASLNAHVESHFPVTLKVAVASHIQEIIESAD